jgi:hypothetical protein
MPPGPWSSRSPSTSSSTSSMTTTGAPSSRHLWFTTRPSSSSTNWTSYSWSSTARTGPSLSPPGGSASPTRPAPSFYSGTTCLTTVGRMHCVCHHRGHHPTHHGFGDQCVSSPSSSTMASARCSMKCQHSVVQAPASVVIRGLGAIVSASCSGGLHRLTCVVPLLRR